LRERFGDVALRAKAERHEQRAQLLAGFGLQSKRAIEVRLIELAALDQDFAESFSGRCIHVRNEKSEVDDALALQ